MDSLLRTFRKNAGLLTHFRFLNFRTKRELIYVKSLIFVGICYSSNIKLIQAPTVFLLSSYALFQPVPHMVARGSALKHKSDHSHSKHQNALCQNKSLFVLFLVLHPCSRLCHISKCSSIGYFPLIINIFLRHNTSIFFQG